MVFMCLFLTVAPLPNCLDIPRSTQNIELPGVSLQLQRAGQYMRPNTPACARCANFGRQTPGHLCSLDSWLGSGRWHWSISQSFWSPALQSESRNQDACGRMVASLDLGRPCDRGEWWRRGRVALDLHDLWSLKSQRRCCPVFRIPKVPN